MEIYCEHCGEEFTTSIKKSHRILNDRVHKTVTCPNCGKKNFPTVLDQKGCNVRDSLKNYFNMPD